MKARNYEKKELVTFLFLITIILEMIFIVVLSTNKEYKYIKISGIVIKDNLVLVVVDKDERKKLYSNKTLYINDSLKKYKIIEDRGKVLNNGYYELVIKYKFDKKHKANDILELVIKDKKFRLIKIFKTIWEGD